MARCTPQLCWAVLSHGGGRSTAVGAAVQDRFGSSRRGARVRNDRRRLPPGSPPVILRAKGLERPGCCWHLLSGPPNMRRHRRR
jgi:hypothetical protein